jgi:hypothetical protein
MRWYLEGSSRSYSRRAVTMSWRRLSGPQKVDAGRSRLRKALRSFRFAPTFPLRERLFQPPIIVAFSTRCILAVIVFLATCGFTGSAGAQGLPSGEPPSHVLNTITSGMGRIYVFRPIRSFGAHIGDYVTVNGVSVHLLTPGTSFYCDVSPGDYVIGVARHKTYPAKISVAAGQSRYVCVMLHHLGGVAPRGGAVTSDQSFEVRLLNPDYGAQRMRGYRLTKVKCQL